MKTLISADNTWALFAILVVVAALAIWMEQKYKWAGKVTGCVIALIGAMILSNIRVIPTDAPAYDLYGHMLYHLQYHFFCLMQM